MEPWDIQNGSVLEVYQKTTKRAWRSALNSTRPWRDHFKPNISSWNISRCGGVTPPLKEGRIRWSPHGHKLQVRTGGLFGMGRLLFCLGLLLVCLIYIYMYNIYIWLGAVGETTKSRPQSRLTISSLCSAMECPSCSPPFWEWRPRRPRHIRWRCLTTMTVAVARTFVQLWMCGKTETFNIMHCCVAFASCKFAKRFDHVLCSCAQTWLE